MAQLKSLIVNGASRFIGDVFANTFTGNLSGNATSATTATSAGNADTLDNLHIHTGRNNEANKIVRTDGNGYLQVGYINSSNGNEGNNSSPARVWGTNGSDNYMRTYLTSALNVGSATYTTYLGTSSANYTYSTLNTVLAGKANSTHTHSYAGSSSAGGAATSANKLNTNAGNNKLPVYFSGGVPVAIDSTDIAISITGSASKLKDNDNSYTYADIVSGIMSQTQTLINNAITTALNTAV